MLSTIFDAAVRIVLAWLVIGVVTALFLPSLPSHDASDSSIVTDESAPE